jgi:hypothetical protein
MFDFYRLDASTPLDVHGPDVAPAPCARVPNMATHVISMSPCHLDWRILCKYREYLGTWPTLPLVVSFFAGRESKPVPRNTMVALRHPDRLLEIDLYVTSLTSSMTGPIIEMMQKPCQELESIRIGVQDSDAMGPGITGSPCIFGRLCPTLERNQAAWCCCLAVPCSTYDKFFRPPATSSIFAFPISRIPSTFHQMTWPQSCPPWSSSNRLQLASIPLHLPHRQV